MYFKDHYPMVYDENVFDLLQQLEDEVEKHDMSSKYTNLRQYSDLRKLCEKFLYKKKKEMKEESRASVKSSKRSFVSSMFNPSEKR